MSNPNLKVRIDEELLSLLTEYCRWAGKDINKYIEEVIVAALYSDLDDMKHNSPRALQLLRKLCEVTGYAVVIPIEDIQRA